MRKLLPLIIIMLTTLLSCQSESTPEGTLDKLVSTRFTSSSKSELESITTGKLKEQIMSMDEKTLSAFLDAKGLKKKKMRVVLKNCDGPKCYLTYVLSYSDKRDGGDRYKLEVKKIAQVENIEGIWKVADISNIKTYIESDQEIKLK